MFLHVVVVIEGVIHRHGSIKETIDVSIMYAESDNVRSPQDYFRTTIIAQQ